jgi:hypothetical protein
VFHRKEWSLSFDTTNKFSETEIINLLEFLIDNMSVIFGGRVFHQTVGIPMPFKLNGIDAISEITKSRIIQ